MVPFTVLITVLVLRTSSLCKKFDKHNGELVRHRKAINRIRITCAATHGAKQTGLILEEDEEGSP